MDEISSHNFLVFPCKTSTPSLSFLFSREKTKQTERKPSRKIPAHFNWCLVNIQSMNIHDFVLNVADFSVLLGVLCFMFLLLSFFLSFFLCIRVACTFLTYSTFSQEVSRFFSLDFVKQWSLAGELVSSPAIKLISIGGDHS